MTDKIVIAEINEAETEKVTEKVAGNSSNPQVGDLVILAHPKGKRYLKKIVLGEDMHGTNGILTMEAILSAKFGSVVYTKLGIPFKVLRPALQDILKGVKRQTQIVYPKDIAYICLRLGVGNGRRIIEAGSGSGSLTIALSWFSGERGHIYTYEAREEFYKLAKRNLAWAGVGENITQHHQDISNGFFEQDVDALFLDVRTPWEYLGAALKAVKPGATLGFLVPTVEQVSRLLTVFERLPVDDVEVLELLLRPWKAVADRLRPEERMIAHTGFLIFARHQETCSVFDSLKPLGTRERKQEKAKQERLSSTFS